jgi:hypothetical protein
MTYLAALTALSQLTVSGIRAHYPASGTPNLLTAAHCPALLVLLHDPFQRGLFAPRERAHAFDSLAFTNGQRTASLTAVHLLLIAPALGGLGMRDAHSKLILLIDAYFAALAQTPTLNGALLEPAQVSAESGTFMVGDLSFYGAALRHRWLIDYTGA